jgi:hypothetical protein
MKPIQAVACASTGDTSASLAAHCAVGIRAVVLFPKGGVTTATGGATRQWRAGSGARYRLRRPYGHVQQLALGAGIYSNS